MLEEHSQRTGLGSDNTNIDLNVVSKVGWSVNPCSRVPLDIGKGQD